MLRKIYFIIFCLFFVLNKKYYNVQFANAGVVVVVGCVLYLKYAQQLKEFFTQIEFASLRAKVAVGVAVAAFGIANFAASHRSLPLTTWKICCHCHVTHKIRH